MALFDRVAIIGPGLIGGSLALEAKEKGLFGHVVASSRKQETLDAALKAKSADEVTTELARCAKGADLVMMAVPMGAMESVARKISESLDEKTIISDVGSVKGDLVGKIKDILPYPSRYVPGHPIAGREKFGPTAATPGLFSGKRCILTPDGSTDPDALEKIRQLWEGVGMTITIMDPYRHDRLLAVTSHLPHIVAYAMVETLIRAKENDPEVTDFTAGGFQDFTRIAASSPDMWRDIFLMNSDNLDEIIELFIQCLNDLRSKATSKDEKRLWEKLENSRRLKNILGAEG